MSGPAPPSRIGSVRGATNSVYPQLGGLFGSGGRSWDEDESLPAVGGFHQLVEPVAVDVWGPVAVELVDDRDPDIDPDTGATAAIFYSIDPRQDEALMAAKLRRNDDLEML